MQRICLKFPKYIKTFYLKHCFFAISAVRVHGIFKSPVYSDEARGHVHMLVTLIKSRIKSTKWMALKSALGLEYLITYILIRKYFCSFQSGFKAIDQ